MKQKQKARADELAEIADGQFDRSITARERAIFEGAITLGALYHQFLGVPLIRNRKVLRLVERAIAETMSLQPYKEEVKIRIRDSEVKGRGRHPFDYVDLGGTMLEAEVVSAYHGSRARLVLRFVPELNYNLMYIAEVKG